MTHASSPEIGMKASDRAEQSRIQWQAYRKESCADAMAARREILREPYKLRLLRHWMISRNGLPCVTTAVHPVRFWIYQPIPRWPHSLRRAEDPNHHLPVRLVCYGLLT